MADKIFDVLITIEKTVRVRVPDDQDVLQGDTPEEVAEEFAQGGRETWPDYFISCDEDLTVESVTRVKNRKAA